MTSRKLYRASEGAWVAGVARGMAEWTGLPVALVRFFWILALLPGGFPGLIAYAVCWVLIPKEPRF